MERETLIGQIAGDVSQGSDGFQTVMMLFKRKTHGLFLYSETLLLAGLHFNRTICDMMKKRNFFSFFQVKRYL
jgi:hypothetical protein